MKLTVVIVNYNVCYYVEQCLESVFRATKGMESEIFVVDNASSDGSVDYLRQKFAKQITLIECQHNLGFARANNIAIRQSTGEYVLLLNPDTFVSEDALQQAVKFMDALELASNEVHVADIRTCVLHPASATHRQLTDEQLVAAGIDGGLVRFSVGLENVDDIIADIQKGFDAIK